MARLPKNTTKEGKPVEAKKFEPTRPHFVSAPAVALPLPGIRHPRNPGSGKFLPVPKITVTASPETKRDRTLLDAGRIRKKVKDTASGGHHPGPVKVKRNKVSFKDEKVHRIAATPGKTPTVIRIEVPPTQMIASPLERRKRGPSKAQ